jgi:hypothetical protein
VIRQLLERIIARDPRPEIAGAVVISMNIRLPGMNDIDQSCRIAL